MSTRPTASLPRVLFIGPSTFQPGVWQTRARDILPDLFRPLHKSARIDLITGPPPHWAQPGLDHLHTQFSVEHHTPSTDPAKGLTGRLTGLLTSAAARTGLVSDVDLWARWTHQVAHQTRPTVITQAHNALVFGAAAVRTAQAVGARSVVRCAGDEIGARLAMGVYKSGDPEHQRDVALQQTAILGADAIIAMSQREADRIAHDTGVEPHKITVCPRGVDLDRFTPPDRSAGSSPPSDPAFLKDLGLPARQPGRLRVLFLGRRSAEKSPDVIETLAQSRPSWDFLFAGTFDTAVEGNRYYLGFVDHQAVPDLLQAADVLVIPSLTEGLPQSMAEALASGLPCIVSRPLFTGLLEDGVSARLVDPRSDELVESLDQLDQDPDVRRTLSAGGRSFAEQHLDQSRLAETYRDTVLAALQ